MVKVANGAFSITSGNITQYSGAPFINYKLPQLSPSGPVARTSLTGNTTYYVSNSGSDSTGTGTTGNPWATFQHAYNQLNGIDCAGFTVNGASQTISTTNADCFTIIGDGLNITLQNMKMQTTTGGNCFVSDDGARVTVGAGVNFGACALQHMSVASNGLVVNCLQNYTISGGAVNHWAVDLSSVLIASGRTITLTGTPAFTTFASAEESSSIQCIGNTFSGSATGDQAIAQINGTINTNGSPTNWPTGLTALGSPTLTGGQII